MFNPSPEERMRILFHSPTNCQEVLIRQGTFSLTDQQGTVRTDIRGQNQCGAQVGTANGNTTTYWVTVLLWEGVVKWLQSHRGSIWDRFFFLLFQYCKNDHSVQSSDLKPPYGIPTFGKASLKNLFQDATDSGMPGVTCTGWCHSWCLCSGKDS